MFQLIILLLCFLVLAFVCYKLSDGFLLTPQMGFVCCFIPPVLYAFFFVEYWSLDFSALTVFTLVFGCTLFAAVSVALSKLLDKSGRFPSAVPTVSFPVECSVWHLGLFLALQIITLVWTVWFLLDCYGGTDLTAAIAHFNDVNKFSETTIELPFILGKLRILSLASGYVWSYLLIHSVINAYHAHKTLLSLNILLCVINSVITGSRTDAFQLFVAFVVMAYVLYGKRHGFTLKIKPKTAAIFAGVCAVLILTFQLVGNMLGRNSDISIWEYIGIYLSAELKNLDTFIRAGEFGAPVSSWQTLISVINVIGSNFGMPELVHKFDLPFHTVNGHDLGNVATTFYAYLYDGGFVALVIFVAIMAAVCQLVYRYSARPVKNGTIPVSLIVYSYIFFTVVFSFFSNKFYEQIFSGYFVYLVIFWLLFRVYIEYFTLDKCKTIIKKITGR